MKTINELINILLKTHSNWDFVEYNHKSKGLWVDDNGNECGCYQMYGNYTKDNIHTLNYERYYNTEEECINELNRLIEFGE